MVTGPPCEFWKTATHERSARSQAVADLAIGALRNIGFASAMFEYSTMYQARPSRFWRSWPNRRSGNGSHNSQVRDEGSSAVRN